MLSSINPFQDYPNNPRTFISNNLIQIQSQHKHSPSQTKIHPKLSSEKYISSLTDLNPGRHFTNPSQIQFTKINFSTKTRSSIYKVHIPPQPDLA